MKIKFKKFNKQAETPTYAKPGDAGLDLTAISREDFLTFIEYDTGIGVEIPSGYVGLVFPRSSISKYELWMANSVGVIDSGYRGSIKVRFKTNSESGFAKYKPGDKIAQLIVMPYPIINLEEVEELGDSERGSGGFGSSGV